MNTPLHKQVWHLCYELRLQLYQVIHQMYFSPQPGETLPLLPPCWKTSVANHSSWPWLKERREEGRGGESPLFRKKITLTAFQYMSINLRNVVWWRKMVGQVAGFLYLLPAFSSPSPAYHPPMHMLVCLSTVLLQSGSWWKSLLFFIYIFRRSWESTFPHNLLDG